METSEILFSVWVIVGLTVLTVILLTGNDNNMNH